MENSAQKYILVLGGTGAMGTHVVNLFNNWGGGVKCVVTSRKCRENKDNVVYVKGNAQDNSFISELLQQRQWTAIIDFMNYTTENFRLRLPMLLDATDQYIFLSSSRVYAESKDLITEDSPRLLDVCKDADYLATDEYALAKARQENLLRESGKNNWTIIRPYITFGELQLQLSSIGKEGWLFRTLEGRTIVFCKDLANTYTTFTYGLDVARGICTLVGNKSAFGDVFHITNAKSYKWIEILHFYIDAIEDVTGKRPKFLLTDNWKKICGGVYQIKYDRLYDRKFDNSKINNFIDVNTFEETKEALNHCIREFIKAPNFSPINYTDEARKDFITHEWTPLSKIPGIKAKLKYLLVRLGLHS